MSELKPCPFCGGEADVLEFYDVEPDDVNFGGSCICCRQCGANSPVHFDRKENLYASWNDRIELRCSAVSAVSASVREAAERVLATAQSADQEQTQALCDLRSALDTLPQTAPTKIADQDLRRRWREAGGEFYGPHVETGSMPEAKLLPFLRSLLNQSPHCQAVSVDLGRLIDWVYLYATEGGGWPDTKTVKDPLIALATKRKPTQEDADRLKAHGTLKQLLALTRPKCGG